MKRLLVIAGIIYALGVVASFATDYAYAHRASDPVAKAFGGIVAKP